MHEFESKSLTEKTPLLDRFVYQDPSMSSSSVSEHTSNIFSTYFGNGEGLTDAAREYLMAKTLPFIDSIRVGLARYPKKIDRLGLGSYDAYSSLINYNNPSVLSPDETLEAFDVALITMGLMPDVAVKKVKDFGGNELSMKFSRRGMLKPPETLTQALKRIEELRVETEKISDNSTPKKINFLEYPSVTRTTLYFDVCKNIPLKNEEGMQRDIEIYIAA